MIIIINIEINDISFDEYPLRGVEQSKTVVVVVDDIVVIVVVVVDVDVVVVVVVVVDGGFVSIVEVC